ncbi:lytic transglycosylase domain-containing protein [Geodermatophilus obscurus]|uniref:Lytic transglycosylase catalytic n=1 Tax=Geodermatophilus obscurus (strain ATCC 25078 / DSM 43160 / JCM 3152 / CCUG 61914 / KCC A-0152 / KCTC 9177 / NBRC 13315 / NRRL B-3577 / G-20) TaxID=526225 RepID=D2S9M1_GEOOG|nr:lytic transglycosylase domain-containing protein [Geodermatophilus obscurus]ADB73734.1 Lytic transglycosylase catalytic [Geodermatophilus obscurus DSM 43160]
MDGLTAVQSRISEIQARFLTAPRPAASADWTAAATAAGLTGTGAATATAPGTAGSASEGAVVAEARKYLGVPYLWGGTDPAKGLDCSGFTKLVYGNLGIDLPRTSSQQATAGRPVANLAEARPGDLVFFDHSSGRPGIDHVGIYVGDGKMIAAPQAGEVVKVQDVGNPSVIRRVLPAGSASHAASPASAASLSGVPYADLFTRAGSRHGVDPALLAAVAQQESGFNASAVSPAGAQGLMQFMPATARGLGVDPFDPASAVDGAARYLADLTEQFGSTELGLAAYNAGPGTVRRYGGIPPYAETQNYVRSVMRKAEALR